MDIYYRRLLPINYPHITSPGELMKTTIHQKQDLVNYIVLGTVLFSFFISELTIYFLSGGTVFVLSHFFYLPIILAAFEFPRRGMILSTLLASIYLLLVYWYLLTDLSSIVTATMQFYVFVSVGIAVSFLSGSIKQSEKRFKDLANLLPQTVFETDERGDFTYTNRSAIEVFGCLPETDGSSQNILEIVAPGDHERLKQDLERAATGESGTSHEYRAVRIDGTECPVMAYIRPIFKEQKHTGFRGIIIDITERKKAEDDQKQLNRRLSVINEIISAATSSTDPGRCLNLSLEKILALTNFETGAIYLLDENTRVARLEILKGVSDEGRAHYLDSMGTIRVDHHEYSTVFSENKPQYIEYGSNGNGHTSILHEGSGILSFAAIPLVAEEKNVGALFIASRRRYRFTADEKAMLEAVGRELGNAILYSMLHDKLAQANREANLYLDIMTHDINNANTVMIGYAEMLQMADDRSTQDYAEKFLRSVRQSINIIDNVSTIRKIHEREAALKPIELDAAIRSEIEHFPNISIDFEPSGATVLADELIAEVFCNLIGNSAKFGGDAVEVAIRVEEENNHYVVSVEDNGPGIPEHEKPQMFNRFQPGSTSKSGKGLGLSICRMLVGDYGGTIWAEDRVPGIPGKGARIKFTVNKANGDGEPEPAASA
jgi:PAS domain S-box-containing protein